VFWSVSKGELRPHSGLFCVEIRHGFQSVTKLCSQGKQMPSDAQKVHKRLRPVFCPTLQTGCCPIRASLRYNKRAPLRLSSCVCTHAPKSVAITSASISEPARHSQHTETYLLPDRRRSTKAAVPTPQNPYAALPVRSPAPPPASSPSETTSLEAAITRNPNHPPCDPHLPHRITQYQSQPLFM
jgi:hypothetical protein